MEINEGVQAMCKYTMSGIIPEFQQHEAGKRSVGEPLFQKLVPQL
jgi:hypothetical protein